MLIPLTHKIPKVPEPLDYAAIASMRDLPVLEFDVTPADVQRWSDLYEDNNPWFFGESPFGGAIAPHSIFYYPGQSAFAPLRDFAGVLALVGHDALGPVRVGSRLTATTRILETYHRRGRAFVAYELDVRDGETPVARARRTWAFGVSADIAAGLPDRGSETPPAEVPPIEDLAPISLDLTVERLADFEGPGERNGHTDVELARRRGDPGPLAQGALSYGLVCRMIANRFGDGWFQAGSIDVRLVKPVYAPMRVTAQGAILRLADGRAELRVNVVNDNGEITLIGQGWAPI